MELSIDQARVIRDPDAATIRRELLALGDQQFAVLRKDDLTFIQTLVDEDQGLVLEYQEGSIQDHFGTVEPPRTMKEVIAAFVSYAQGTEEWKRAFDWVRMELTHSDYTVVVIADPDAVDHIDNPLEWEERIELPNLGVDHLIALYAALVDESPAALEAEFSVFAETQPEGMDGVLLVKTPLSFQMALANASPDALDSLAARWQATDHFPYTDYDEAAAKDVIVALAAMAQEAAESGKNLVLCALQ